MRLLVADLMKKREITAHALCKGSNDRISRSTAYRLARGEKVSLRPEEIAALCDVLELEPNDLFDRQPGRKVKR
jgi:DNA-binding Xre family transcriptional regulator